MAKNQPLISKVNPKSPFAEAYRTLRTNIQFANPDKDIKTIMVTSAGPGEGKSTTVCNLALAIAQSEKKVLVIDADLRRSNIHKIFGLPNLDGLTTLLTEDININAAVSFIDVPNLYVLTSGPKPPNPSELLGSKRMEALLTKVKDEFDIILIDAPPILPVADASVLGTIVDGSIMLINYGQVDFDLAAKAKEQLEKVNARIMGVIINNIPNNGDSYYYYYYYSYYDDDKGKQRKKSYRHRRKRKSSYYNA
ncbi:MAG: CpsD/CapB family tyrosine-protein kinase [Mahellales bacterium]|jgi:capsular exopolysaccharide synthesis family protein